MFNKNFITMKNITLIFLIAVFEFACKNDNAKVYFDAGAKKMVITMDSAQRIANYKSALIDFNKAIEINPNYVGAYLYRANIEDEFGDYKGFLQDCKKASEIDPNNTNVYVYLSRVKRLHNDINGAMAAVNKALQIDNKLGRAYADRSEIENDQKNYKAALTDLNSSINYTSDKESLKYLYSNRAFVELKLEDKNNACTDFHKALELGNPNAQGEINSYCK